MTHLPANQHAVPMKVVERFGRSTVSSSAKWELIVGYSRAVRSGNFIAVTGTVGMNLDGTYPPTIEQQTRRSLVIIEAALTALGARMEHVIRTRMFTTDISQWEKIGSVHGQVFGEIRPATTLVQVAKLIDDAALIEIEADAIVPPP
jgi:enamine deaminase RidA (YjgF/YER057c/UK114 family)